MDGEKPSRRMELLPEYKAHRPPTPPELVQQLEIMNDLIPLLGWPVIRQHDEEADDVAASLAVATAAIGGTARILSNDKDLLQVVGPGIGVIRSSPRETLLVGEAWVRERWGIRPDQIVDFLALQGDSADNIPGVPGVGEKTATELIRNYGSLDALEAGLDSVKSARIRESLRTHMGVARRNQQIIRLKTDAPLPPLDEFRLKEPDYGRLLPRLSELELKGLLGFYQEQSEQQGKPRQGLLF
jgi:DNA polymerase-1